MMKANFLSDYLTDFLLDFLPQSKGRSNNTIKSYAFAFMLFFEYMKEVKNIKAERIKLEDVKSDLVVDYLKWLKTERNCSNRTINQRRAAITSFADFIIYKCPEFSGIYRAVIAVPQIKTEEKAISYLSLNGIKLLLKQPNTNTKSGLRDLCLLHVMFETAARVQEVIDLTPSSVRLSGEISTILLHGKGNKVKTVPVSDDVSDILKTYMESVGLDGQENLQKPLFPNKQGGKLSRNAVNNILVKHADAARKINPSLVPEKLSCHSIRHSKAMALIEKGVELIHIRDFLRHKSVRTTEIYAKVNPKFNFEAIKKAYENVNEVVPRWKGDKGIMDMLRKLSK